MDVVIRFWRQTYYKNDPHIFQAQVRQAPLPIQTGEFRVDIGQQLEDLRRALEYEVRLSQFFADHPKAEAYNALDLGAKFFRMLPLSFQAELPRLVQLVAERGCGLRLILEADTSDPAVHLLSLPWELLFHRTPLYAAHSPRLHIVRRVLGAARRTGPGISPPLRLVRPDCRNACAPGRLRPYSTPNVPPSKVWSRPNTICSSPTQGHWSG